MTWHAIVKTLWPLALLVFLCLSVAQVSERLRGKGCNVQLSRPNQTTLVELGYLPPPTRLDAMLGGACVILAAFWGFDAMLSWWLHYITS